MEKRIGDVAKIMGLVSISRKNEMKKIGHVVKISLLE